MDYLFSSDSSDSLFTSIISTPAKEQEQEQEGTQFLTNEGQQKTIYFFNGDPLIPIYDKETKQLSTKTVEVNDDLIAKIDSPPTYGQPIVHDRIGFIRSVEGCSQ